MTSPVGSDRAVIEERTCDRAGERPAEFNAQAPLDVISEMRDDVSLDLIEDIEVATYWLAWHEIGMDEAKWDPRSRETADHSLPYLLAVALVDGVLDVSSCAPARVADPSLRPLMRKIRVIERPEFTRAFPSEFNVEISIRQRNTPTLVKRAAYPHGHPRKPATDADLDAKLAVLRSPPCSDAARRVACEEIEASWRGTWSMPRNVKAADGSTHQACPRRRRNGPPRRG